MTRETRDKIIELLKAEGYEYVETHRYDAKWVRTTMKIPDPVAILVPTIHIDEILKYPVE